MAYDKVEPFGEPVVNIQLARILSLLTNFFSKTKVMPEDYILGYERKIIKQTPEEMKQILMGMAGK